MIQLNFAVVGCGKVSERHINSILKSPNANLVAVFDTVEEKAEKYSSKNVKIYSDYEKLLLNKNIDVFSICTPSGLHAEMSIAALEEKKHVLCEKPMAIKTKDADRMIASSNENGRILGIVMQNRFNKPIQKLKKAIQDGRLGKILLGNATVRWYRPQSYYEDEWHGTKNMDGGLLMNQAIHYIDAIEWLMGGVVKKVFSKTAILAHQIETEDVGLAILEFDNGSLANIESSTIIYPKNLEGSISIFGEKGSVKIGGTSLNRIDTWRLENESEEAVLSEQNDKDPSSEYGYSHSLVYENFINSINKDSPPLTGGKEGRKSVRLVNAMLLSSEKGKFITID